MSRACSRAVRALFHVQNSSVRVSSGSSGSKVPSASDCRSVSAAPLSQFVNKKSVSKVVLATSCEAEVMHHCRFHLVTCRLPCLLEKPRAYSPSYIHVWNISSKLLIHVSKYICKTFLSSLIKSIIHVDIYFSPNGIWLECMHAEGFLGNCLVHYQATYPAE